MDVIREYAARRNLDIVKTYSNEGKSGLNIQGRDSLSRMEMEMETLEREFKVAEDKYSENMLNPTVLLGYVSRLLGNAKIVKFLGARHAEMLAEFERVAASDGV